MLNDYLTLCKPRVVLLMLITAWVGMALASQNVVWPTLIFATLGIASAASSAAILNHLLDRSIDQKMSRTAQRPIASGRISPRQASIFALSLAAIAWIILSQLVNTTTAVLTFATLVGYAAVYNIYLKRATPQNIVIGGLAGAMPPLLGWTAITGQINPYSWLLVLIIFTWTPPHFWALAIYRIKDYAAADIPMLPVTHGIHFTKLCILLYTILLSAVTCLPFATQMSNWPYFIVAIILDGIFISFALRLYFASKDQEHNIAIKTFNFSITYLALLFIALLFDHHFGAHL